MDNLNQATQISVRDNGEFEVAGLMYITKLFFRRKKNYKMAKEKFKIFSLSF